MTKEQKKSEKGKLLETFVEDKNEEHSGTIVRRSWKYEVYGFLLGVLSSFFSAFSASCVRAMKRAIPDIEVSNTRCRDKILIPGTEVT